MLLHLLKIVLYAAFGLLPGSALVAGGLVAAAAVLASFASRRLLSRMHEGLFRRAGLLAMVASGVAMFSLSGGELMAIHRAWVAYVAPGDEREVQLYWGGARRLAIEQEEDGHVVVERDFHVLGDELRQWFIDERDEKGRMVELELDPGVADECPDGCPYWSVCHAA